MWSVLKQSPLRTALTAAYLVFMGVFLVLNFLPASAEDAASGTLAIPSTGTFVSVTPSSLEDGQFYVPSRIVGAYSRGRKTFLMGHSTTAFRRLHLINTGDDIFYAGHHYRAVEIRDLPLAKISMKEVLRNDSAESLVLMTCSGENDSRRLIVSAALVR